MSSVTIVSPTGPLNLTGSTQQESAVYPSWNQALAWLTDMKEESCGSVSGLENRPEEGSSQGQAWQHKCTGLGSQRATLVFTQGCGADDVNYVLPSGHLRPPGHLHWLLGRDSFVSFIQPPLESMGTGRGVRGGARAGLGAQDRSHEGMWDCIARVSLG